MQTLSRLIYEEKQSSALNDVNKNEIKVVPATYDDYTLCSHLAYDTNETMFNPFNLFHCNFSFVASAVKWISIWKHKIVMTSRLVSITLSIYSG